MTAYFGDSSAIIKRYTIEVGSEWIRALTSLQRADQVFVAQITRVEVVSGLARLHREGTLTPQALRLARQSIERHMGRDYDVIALSARIIRRAKDLLSHYPLRAYDAMQLASALDLRAQLLNTNRIAPIFVSADRRLLAAADAEGLPTDDPNEHA